MQSGRGDPALNRDEYYKLFKDGGFVNSRDELNQLSKEEFTGILSALMTVPMIPEQTNSLDEQLEKLISELAVREETTEEKIASLKNPVKTSSTKSVSDLMNAGKMIACDIISCHQESLEGIATSKVSRLE